MLPRLNVIYIRGYLNNIFLEKYIIHDYTRLTLSYAGYYINTNSRHISHILKRMKNGNRKILLTL